MDQPPLQFLHAEDRLIRLKLEYLEKITTDQLVESLSPGREGSLKTRPDGTVIDGHHRLFILQKRGFPIHSLPRDVIMHQDFE
ncbi:hypothetical protein LLG95_07475 [bacterium]|nr:hypothetical protein [bacterium]